MDCEYEFRWNNQEVEVERSGLLPLKLNSVRADLSFSDLLNPRTLIEKEPEVASKKEENEGFEMTEDEERELAELMDSD